MPKASTGYEVVSATLTGAASPVTLTAPTGMGIVGFYGVHATGGASGQLVAWGSGGELCRPAALDGSGNLVAVEFSQSLGSTKTVYAVCVGL